MAVLPYIRLAFRKASVLADIGWATLTYDPVG
jgi:hypothetical protein